MSEAENDKKPKLIVCVNPYLKYAITVVLMAYFSWLVLQIDNIRNTYPLTFVKTEQYEKDMNSLNEQITSLRTEQLEQRKLTQQEFTSLRNEMNIGFRETRELILTLNKSK